MHSYGAGFAPPAGTPARDAITLVHALQTGITDATRPAIIVAAGFVTFGALLSLLIPRIGPDPPRRERRPLTDAFEGLEPHRTPARVRLRTGSRTGTVRIRQPIAPIRSSRPSEDPLHRDLDGDAVGVHAGILVPPARTRATASAISSGSRVTRAGPSSESHRPPSTWPTAARRGPVPRCAPSATRHR